MDIFNVECPSCCRVYYADMLLYSLKIELHCPYCGVYFYKEDSPRVQTGGAGASAVAQTAGGLSEEMIFRPAQEDE